VPEFSYIPMQKVTNCIKLFIYSTLLNNNIFEIQIRYKYFKKIIFED
jgi:hypothetical protein